MGGKSTSSSTSQTTTNLTDSRTVGTDQALVLGSHAAANFQLVTTDHGAMNVGAHLGTHGLNVASAATGEAVRGIAAVSARGFDTVGKVARDAFQTVGDANARSLDFARGTVGETYEFAGGVSDRAFALLDAANRRSVDLAGDTNKSITDIASDALAKVDAANRDEAARNVDALIKALMYGGIAFAAAWAIRKGGLRL